MPKHKLMAASFSQGWFSIHNGTTVTTVSVAELGVKD